MHRCRALAGLLMLCSLASFSLSDFRPDQNSTPSAGSPGIHFNRPPLRFEINEGQTDPQVRFTVRGSDGISFLTSDGITFQIARTHDDGFESSYVQLKLAGASPDARAIGLEPLPGMTNYFLGSDKRNWRTNVPGYAKVRYERVYPGIDLLYYDNGDGALEYDFLVAPGSDPAQILLSIEGSQDAEILSSGDLMITAPTGRIHQPAPRIYQDIGGTRQEIAGRYKLVREPGSDPMIAFDVEAYDRGKPLIIDPEIIYATYLGGTSTSTIGNEGARSVAVDAQGAVYITGDAISADFPTRNPAQSVRFGFVNAFITKLDASGQMVYSTFLGGSGFDGPTTIKVDDTGAAYLAGSTSSADFPTVNPIQGRGNRNDAFVTKLSASGSQIVYSTYLGKEDNENVSELALDPLRNVVVVGNIRPALGSSANDFPLVNPIQAAYGGGSSDGFMSAVSASGNRLLFSTYLGGDGEDIFQSVDIIAKTNGRHDIQFGFYTDSSNFPVTPATATKADISSVANANAGPRAGAGVFTDVEGNQYMISVFSRNGVPIGYLGVTPEKVIEQRSLGVEILTGISFLPGEVIEDLSAFPALPAQTQPIGGLDVQLTVSDQNINPIMTVYFGGSGEDVISGLTTDSSRAAYVIGRTRSTNLPVLNPVQATHAGGNAFDGFLAVLAPDTLDPVFATYLGGTGMESLTDVTVDSQGNIYVVGETFGGFPTATSGAIQTQLRGRTDAFVIKISPAVPQTPPPTNLTPYTFQNRGGVSLRTEGISPSTTVGYGRIQPGSGSSAPSGLAIFGFRPAGVLVTEAAVPASALLQSGRIYAEVNGPVNTGLAIANPNAQPATLTFNFTDVNGQTFGSGTTTIPANSQIAAFLNDAPFNGGNSLQGTFNFSSNVPIAAIALRGFTNERCEFLITTLPVSDLAAPVPTGETIVFPHFAEGGGWTTQVVLVNPTDAALSGNLQFFNPAGAAATLTVDGQSGTTFPYSIAPRSARRFQSSGLGATQVGSARITPSAGGRTPSGVVIFTYKADGITVSEAGVSALRTASAFRLYAEAAGNFEASAIGSIETGIAIANSSASPANVTFELTRLDGTSAGLSGSVGVPGNGQTALFLNQIAGFTSLGNPNAPFQGVLRIASTSSAIAVVGLRGRYNERRDFLITTTAPVDEASVPPATELFFPHLADSGGYTTQFVLFSGSAGQSSSGSIRLLSQSGQNFNLPLR
jgi:hypothetical protein